MRFLIAQTSFLGDVILSTPVFTALRLRYRDAHITALVRPETAAVLNDHPDVDAVITDDKRGSERGLGSLRVLQKVKDGDFDIALALHKSFRTAWLLAAAGIGWRIGFRQSAGWFLYHRRVYRDASRHDVERNLSILAGLGLDPQTIPARPFIACAPEAVARFHAMLAERRVAAHARLIGVAPGSVWATKRWTVEGYAALLTQIRNELHAVPVLLGARGDIECAAAIQHAGGELGVNLVGQTDLPLLVAAIDQCSALVTNDSAPAHIAAARSTPVVAIFGPTTPAQGFAPYTTRAAIVQRDLPCRPCGRHGGARCPLGTHACMREITAHDVQSALEPLLDRYANDTHRAAGRA
jgi:heptosyltransferase II